MKSISLTQGRFAIVDDEDYEILREYKWYADKIGDAFYAARSLPKVNGKKRTIRMHRDILGLSGSKTYCDHIDMDGLNNQRSNLRVCTNSENNMNKGKQKNNTSGYKGVTFHKDSGKWMAQIWIQRKRIYLGIFDKAEMAYSAYCKAAQEIHGEYARIS